MECLKTVLTSKEIKLIKKEEDLIKKADMLVSRFFENKLDKGGVPYINHLYYVRDHVSDYYEKVIALLHDTVEDTSITLDALRYLEFPDLVIESIDLLTHRKTIENKERDYLNYVKKILNSNNTYAINVKKADMEHNMDKTRLSKLDVATREKLVSKYEMAQNLIKNYFDK